MSEHHGSGTTVNEDRLQVLLAKEAELELLKAELSLRSLPLSTSPSSASHLGRIHKQQHQRRGSNISRSNSHNGIAPMVRHPSSDRIEIPQQRSRTFSQHSAPMARTNSKNSTSQRSGNLPFTRNGAMPPPLNLDARRENPTMMAWTQQEQPLSQYNLSHQPLQLQRSPLQRGSALEQVLEDLTDPGDFIRNLSTPFSAVSPSIPIPSSSATMSSHHLSGSYTIPTPLTPTSDMLTNATTLETMSRQDSLCNDLFLERVQGMKFGSNSSCSPDVNYDHVLYDHVPYFSSLPPRRSSEEEQSKLLVGAGANHESQISHSLSLQSSPFGEKMEKSDSLESTSSSSSSSRNVKRLQDQIRLADARPLMPKGGSVDNMMSRESSSQAVTRLMSRDGSQDNKVAITSKSTYQRPKHDRVYCNDCENHPDGFRGQHELSRHQDREHKSLVKKWMCVEPEDYQHIKPVVPFSRCKACSSQKKYGAYYNAAAHLRRAHFKPKAKGRGKNARVEDAEKRGGKGGGDWPPMSVLKQWMQEVEEPAIDYNDDEPSTVADAEEQDVADFLDDNPSSQQSISTMASHSFDHTFLADTSILTIYPTSVSNDMFDSPMPHLDLSSTLQQTRCSVDSSMFNTSNVQNNFSSFSADVYQNEQQMFCDSSSFLAVENVEDHILVGPDFVQNHFY